jgi:hypothetical protein
MILKRLKKISAGLDRKPKIKDTNMFQYDIWTKKQNCLIQQTAHTTYS